MHDVLRVDGVAYEIWPRAPFMHILPGMLHIDNLSKRYGDRRLFQALTHTFPPGCVALCEEDSTGKSSLLGIIAGVIVPDEGDVWIDGHSLIQTPLQAKARMAYVPDNCLASPMQTGRGLLKQVASEKNTTLHEGVLDLAYKLGLEPHLDKRFEQMSTGTRRKIFLTAAALGEPAVILADGPSNGLDKQARAVLAEQFKIWSRDRVVLFASHDPELVQACGATAIKVAALR
jgi:ABC-2 type transport system ATP-binding protein